MRLLAGGSGTHLVLLAAVLSAASCTAILGIGGDFKQAGGGGATPHGGGTPSTSSSIGGTTTQGTGGSGASSTSAAGGSGGASSMCPNGDPMCTDCIEANCAAELNGSGGGGGTGCLGNPTCASWYDCLKSCCDDDCATTCDKDYNVQSSYQPVYACGCSACATHDGGQGLCAAFDTCDLHPCKQPPAYAPSPGHVYCPFGSTEAGTQLSCASGTEHCCAPVVLGSTSTCENINVPCGDSSDRDWQCDEPGDTDCTNMVCCAISFDDVVFADTKQCLTQAGASVFSTHCQGSCNIAQHQYPVCTVDADCTAPKTCWQIATHGFNIGICH